MMARRRGGPVGLGGRGGMRAHVPVFAVGGTVSGYARL